MGRKRFLTIGPVVNIITYILGSDTLLIPTTTLFLPGNPEEFM